MDLNRHLSYLHALFELYSSKAISIKWSKDKAGMNSSVNLEFELKKMDASFEEQEFLDVAFETLSLIRLIVLGEPVDTEDEKIEAIHNTFLRGEKEREDILIQCSTKCHTIEEFDFEIMTKRKGNDPTKILGYSSMISLKLREPELNDGEASTKILVEASRKDIETMIRDLKGILKNMDKLEGKEL